MSVGRTASVVTKRFSFWFVTAGVLMLVGIALAREWQRSLDLQAEVAAARVRLADVTTVRAENQRLRANEIPTEELARLRADHAALPRLRAELQTLSSGVGAPQPTAPR